MGTTPPDPPPPDWDSISGSSAEFNLAQSNATNYGWDSTNLAIKDANGSPNYLCVGVSATSGHVAWFCRAAADNSKNCVQAQVPQNTFNAIKNGSLNTQNGQISYSGHVYQLKLERDTTTGNAIAYLFQIS
jgi:hypothetical protein